MSNKHNQGGIFSGRLKRAEFIAYYFMNLFICFCLFSATLQFPSGSFLKALLAFVGVVIYLFFLAIIIVKRAHDINLSGLWYWMIFVPFANLIFLIMLLVTRGTEGPNKYGEDPLAEESRRAQDEKDSAAASFCPQCKAQYREGFSTCSECGIPLERFSEAG